MRGDQRYGSPRTRIWLISCPNLSRIVSPAPSRANTDAGLAGLVSTALRGQWPASQSFALNIVPWSAKRAASASDHDTTIGAALSLNPESIESSAGLLWLEPT